MEAVTAPASPEAFNLNIRQCIPEDLSTAQAFLREVLAEGANGFDMSRIDHRLSLVASEAGATLGVALCDSSLGAGERRVSVIARTDHPGLVRMLVDKASGKLHTHGVHKFKVVLHDGSDPQSLWQSSRWTGASSESVGPACEAPPAAPKNEQAKATPAAAA